MHQKKKSAGLTFLNDVSNVEYTLKTQTRKLKEDRGNMKDREGRPTYR